MDKNSRGNFADGRTNNIHIWNTLNVDGDAEDWDAAKGRRSGYVKRTVKIPKSTYDTIKYMRGWDFDESFKSYNLNPFVMTVCSTYARDFWNKYVGFSSNNTRILNRQPSVTTLPGNIVDTINDLGSLGY